MIMTGLIALFGVCIILIVCKFRVSVRNAPTLRSRRFQVYSVFWTLQYIVLYAIVYFWTLDAVEEQFPRGSGWHGVGMALNIFVTIPIFALIPFVIQWDCTRRLRGIVENDIGMPGLQVESYTYPQVEQQFYLSLFTNLFLAIAVHAAFVLNVFLFSEDQAAISFVFLAQIVGGMALIAVAAALYYSFGRQFLETCRTKQNFLATPPLIDHALDVLLKTKFDGTFDEETVLREAIAQFDPVTMTEDEPEVAAKPFPKLWLWLGGLYTTILVAMFCLAVMFPFHSPRQMLLQTGIIHSYTVPSDFVPWDSGRYFRRGIRAMNENDLPRAIKEFSFAIRLNPKYADAYSSRARCWLRLPDGEHKEVHIEKAIADMTEAIRVSEPWNEIYYIFRADLYDEFGEPEKAAADREKVK